MIHILTDGIQLNPIDSWIVLILKYGAGWAAVIVAIIALYLNRKPLKMIILSNKINKLKAAKHALECKSGFTVNDKAEVEQVHSDKAKKRFLFRNPFKLFGKLKESPTVLQDVCADMSKEDVKDAIGKLDKKQEEYLDEFIKLL